MVASSTKEYSRRAILPGSFDAANLWGENMRLIIWIYGYLSWCTAAFEDGSSAVCDSLCGCSAVICITNGNIMRQTEEKAVVVVAALRRFLLPRIATSWPFLSACDHDFYHLA